MTCTNLKFSILAVRFKQKHLDCALEMSYRMILIKSRIIGISPYQKAKAGVPVIMYFRPEKFGRIDCLFAVSDKLRELKDELQELGVEDEIDPIWEEYF